MNTVTAGSTTDDYSLRLAFEGAIACPSGDPIGLDYFTHAFGPMRRGPESVAPRAAYTGLFCPHFMLKGPVGSEKHFPLGIHQPTQLRHLDKVLSAAGVLRTPLDKEGLDNGRGGAHDPPP